MMNLNILNNIDEEDGLETRTINVTFIDLMTIYFWYNKWIFKISFNNSLTEYDSKYGIDGYVWAPIKRINGKIIFWIN